MSSCPIFFCDPLEDKIVYTRIIQRRRSFCASPSCRPQLRFGLQSLGSAQKDSLLLSMILVYVIYYFQLKQRYVLYGLSFVDLINANGKHRFLRNSDRVFSFNTSLQSHTNRKILANGVFCNGFSLFC
jgi:hypothetical protein